MLAAGTTCSITVTVSPSTAGAESAALSLTDNAANSPQGVDLVGIGQEPVVSASPQLVSFGNQPEGKASAQQVVTLRNTCNLALDISNISLTLLGTSQYNIMGNSSSAGVPIVQPGASCS